MPDISKRAWWKEVRDYALLTIAMLSYCIGWCVFLLPNNITTGGVAGIASILEWSALHIPAQVSYFAINACLLIVALRILGWKFCVKTVYAVVVLTVSLSIVREHTAGLHLLADQPFMASILGAVFCADVIIITSSYLVLRDWERVIYGYVVLYVTAFCLDQVVNSMRRSVQFFIISEKYEDIGHRINEVVHRGCTIINGQGFYSGHDVKVLFVLCKQSQSALIFQLIDEVDPHAFVSQSAVIGVYGEGFDRFKVKKHK